MSVIKYLGSKAGETKLRMKHPGARMLRDCGGENSAGEISGGASGARILPNKISKVSQGSHQNTDS